MYPDLGALLAEATLVVVGRVTEVRPGPVIGPPSDWPADLDPRLGTESYVEIRVAVEELLSGTPAPEATREDGTVAIARWAGNASSQAEALAALQHHLPTGRTILFLTQLAADPSRIGPTAAPRGAPSDEQTIPPPPLTEMDLRGIAALRPYYSTIGVQAVWAEEGGLTVLPAALEPDLAGFGARYVGRPFEQVVDELRAEIRRLGR